MLRTTVRVGGMTCGHCNMAIERAVSAVDGVDRVTADFGTGVVDVTFRSDPDAAVRRAIEEEGYDVISIDSINDPTSGAQL